VNEATVEKPLLYVLAANLKNLPDVDPTRLSASTLQPRLHRCSYQEAAPLTRA
jgi:hypothetical protein